MTEEVTSKSAKQQKAWLSLNLKEEAYLLDLFRKHFTDFEAGHTALQILRFIKLPSFPLLNEFDAETFLDTSKTSKEQQVNQIFVFHYYAPSHRAVIVEETAHSLEEAFAFLERVINLFVELREHIKEMAEKEEHWQEITSEEETETITTVEPSDALAELLYFYFHDNWLLEAERFRERLGAKE
ncbi:MAG: hypothetical protein GF308_11610 [Candidatus Heimdallarchaeota archaeon]|nr:hypothetical protein [Candidatus Heimdallarchaeota archaeon]